MNTGEKYRTIRILFGICSGIILIAVSPLHFISIYTLQIILLFLVTTIGLSHGSLDWMLARHWGLRNTIKQGILFGITYMGIALASFLAWQMYPGAGLIIFLIISILHFAGDWRKELNHSMAFTVGVAVISIPAVRFQHDVAALFTLLVPSLEAEFITKILRSFGWFSVLITLPITVRKACIDSQWWLITEIIGLMLLGLLVTPLLYFALYFCNLHALKHWLSMRDIGVYKHISKILWSACWPTIICILLGVAMIFKNSHLDLSAVFIKTVFVGLAALTVPHLLLLEVYPKTAFFLRRLRQQTA